MEIWSHRDDLIKHLDHIQGQLERGLGYFQQQRPEIDEDCIERNKERYGRLKTALLRVDERAMEILTRMPLRLILFDQCTNSCGCLRNPFNLRVCSASSVSVIQNGRCHFLGLMAGAQLCFSFLVWSITQSTFLRLPFCPHMFNQFFECLVNCKSSNLPVHTPVQRDE